MKHTLPEVLAPAGSPECLTAAVRCGAAAVYLGVEEFNARRAAHNFTIADLKEAVAYCHARGVAVYLTLNTLVRQEELETVLDRFPDLKLCAAHFGYIADDFDRCKRAVERWKNFSFDFTPGAATFDAFTDKHAEWREFLEKYSDRLYFGTDTYNRVEEADISLGTYENTGGRYRLVRGMLEYTPDREVIQSGFKPFKPVCLSDEALENIYFANVDRLLGEGRELNRALILSEAEKLLESTLAGNETYTDPEERALEIENLKTVISYFK